METNILEPVGELLFGKTRQGVLRLLFARPDESFHLRQIVRLTGAGLGPVQREVTRLSAAGLLVREPRGRQVFYSVNQQSPVYPELRELVIKTVGLVEVLRQAILPLAAQIRVVFVFGSLARGEQHRASDIDLMVITDLPFSLIARAVAEPQRRLGREVNLNVIPPDDFANRVGRHDPFLTGVISEPKLFVLGNEHELKGMADERPDSTAPTDAARDRRTSRRDRARPRRVGGRAHR